MLPISCTDTKAQSNTVWLGILAGNIFWQIGDFESNSPIFHPPKIQCDVIICKIRACVLGLQLDAPV